MTFGYVQGNAFEMIESMNEVGIELLVLGQLQISFRHGRDAKILPWSLVWAKMVSVDIFFLDTIPMYV